MPPEPGPEPEKQEGKVEGRIELTLEEKYKIAGKRESILSRRGVEISIADLDMLLKVIVIEDRNDLETIANQVEEKHVEVGGRGSNEVMSSSEVKERKLIVEEYVYKYGFGQHNSAELMEEWIRESLKWVKSEGTPRAQIIHNLWVADILEAGGKVDEAIEKASEAYTLALQDNHQDIVNDILKWFPGVVKNESEG